MAEPKKRTLRGVYDGLKQISDEEGIDFGIDNYTYEQFAHKYGNKNSLAALHKLLSTISDEEAVDFGIGSADEWLNSFNYNNAAQAVDWDSQPTAATQPTAQQPAQRKTRYDVAQEQYEQGRQQTNATPISQTAMGSVGGYGISPTGIPVRNTQGYPMAHPQPQAPAKPMAPAPRAGQWSGAPMQQTPYAPTEEEGNKSFMPIEQGEDTKARYDAQRNAVGGQGGQVETMRSDIDSRLQEAYQRDLDNYGSELDKGGFWARMGRSVQAAEGNNPAANAVPSQLSDDTRDYQAAKHALDNSQKIIDEANAASRNGNFIAGAGRGMRDKFFDVSTWDFGITDVTDQAAILRALEAYDKGEELTESQRALLDAKAVELATTAYFGSELGRGYKAGQVTAEAIPFMFEMAINPAAGIGKGASKAMVRYALKRFGKEAIEKGGKRYVAKQAMKYGTRIVGDVAGAGTMAATTGAARTAADAMQRMAGNLHYGTDEQGNITFDGHTDAESVMKAFGKAFASTTIENYSEMLGNYFGPALGLLGKGAGKVGKGLSQTRVADFIRKINAGKTAQFLTELESRAQWHGVMGEYAEEVAGGILNALVVGDQTLDTDQDTGVFNLDNNIDTFLGVALMGGFFSGAKTVGYGVERAYNARQFKKANRMGAAAFGDGWADVQAAIESDPKAGAVAVLKDRLSTKEQREAVLRYAAAVTARQGMEQGKAKRDAEGIQTMQEAAAEQSYNTGYEDANTDELRSDINMAYTDARQTLVGLIGEDNVGVIDEDPLGMQRLYDNDPNVSDEVTWAVAEYVSAKSAWDGVQQRISDDAADRADQRRAEGEKMAYKGKGDMQGMLRPLTINEESSERDPETGERIKKTVYLVNGTIAIEPNGNGLSREGTDKTIYVYDPETGEAHELDPFGGAGVLSVGDVVSMEDYLADNEQQRQAEVQQAAETAQGKVKVNTHFITPQGRKGVVQTIEGDNAIVLFADGEMEQASMPLAEVQQYADALRRQEYEARHPQQNQPQTPAEQPQQPNTATEGQNTVGAEVAAEYLLGSGANAINSTDYLLKALSGIFSNAQSSIEAIRLKYQQQFVQQPYADIDNFVNSDLYEQIVGEVRNAINAAYGNNSIEAQTILDEILKSPKGLPYRTGQDISRRVESLNAQQTPTGGGNAAVERPQVEYPRDKQGNIDYDKIGDAATFATALGEEFGEDAPATLDDIIAEETAKMDKQNAVGKARIRKRLAMLEEAKAQLTPSEEAPAEAPTAEVEQPTAQITPQAGEVPDMSVDKASDARARGYRMQSGVRYDRQGATEGVVGSETEVKFTNKEKPVKGRWKVVEAGSVQPSHVGGQNNPLHFITEAQPKDRTDKVSDAESDKIAAHINPKEIIDGVTAYTGAPVVNSRGEVIQGNNRATALRKMGSYPESAAKYKQYLIDHAADYGLNAEDIASMNNPVMVREVDVDDNEAIRLGQFTASDTESGGKERISADKVLGKLTDEQTASVLNIMLRGGEETDETLMQLIDRNGADVLTYLAGQGAINDTQVQSAYGRDGRMTPEAKNDLADMVTQNIFKGGADNIKKVWNEYMPVAAQKALLQAMAGDMRLPVEDRLIKYVRNAIMAVGEIKNNPFTKDAKTAEEYHKGLDMDARQADMLSRPIKERYSELELYIAVDLLLTKKQNAIKAIFWDYQRLFLEKGADLFEAPKEYTPEEAIEKVFGIKLNKTDNNEQGNDPGGSHETGTSETGETAGNGELGRGERSPEGESGTAGQAGEQAAVSKAETAQQPKEEAEGGTGTAPQPVGGVPAQSETPAEQPRAAVGEGENKEPKEPKRLISDEQMDELKERLRKKLRGQLNSGIDPETLSIGLQLAVGHIERGLTKFADFAKRMIEDLGDAIRPYLKSFYNGARDFPGAEKLAEQMTPYEEVRAFDVENFDKARPSSLVDYAKEIAAEQEIEKQVEQIKKPTKGNKKEDSTLSNTEQGQLDLFGSPSDTETETPSESNLKFTEEQRAKVSEWVKGDLLRGLDSGERPFKSVADIRKMAQRAGLDVDMDGRDDVALQEMVEDGLVRAARLIIERGGYGGSKSRTAYEAICQLYDLQPTISRRSDNRVKMQQYSTPLPMAFVADMFAWKPNSRTLEPTAGNGMLVFAIPAKDVVVNELDETRLANLRQQGFEIVLNEDATSAAFTPKAYDSILANPPFGKAEAKMYDGKSIAGLDEQIALNALAAMKDNGKASIIIGGNMEYGSNGAIKGNKAFWTYLYDHYNVKGVVDMAGKLYAKQGTTYPTRMILIDGRRSEEERAQSTIYPPRKHEAIRKAETFEDLYDIVTEVLNSNKKTNGNEVLRSGTDVHYAVGQQRDTPVQRSSVEHHEDVPNGRGRSGRGERVEDVGRNGGNRLQKPEGSGRTGIRESGVSRVPGESTPVSGDGERTKVTSSGGITDGRGQRESADGSRGEQTADGGVERVSVGDVQGDVSGERRRNGVEKKRTLTEEKLSYRPHNSAFSLQSVAPAAMVEAMDKSLAEIESKWGNIDEFVTNELGYDSVEEMHNALAAEQVDSVAMAIYQMQQGKAMIIGDQTGVGKGRQMAALIRWANRHGKKPIFITKDATLFTDIYRDLVDIGSGDLRPFIFNKYEKGKPTSGEMVDADGKLVYKGADDATWKKVLASGELPEDCDFAVLTYSQVNTGDKLSSEAGKDYAKESGNRSKKTNAEKNNKPTPKATFLRNIAQSNYLFLDESHTAAGDSNVGAFIRSIIGTYAGSQAGYAQGVNTGGVAGVTFASATFAKRPDTMPMYAMRTAMSEANVQPYELISIIARGGVTLQEIMSRALTESGQMVRRERDMSDVRTDWETIDNPELVQRARENYDKTIVAFNAIIKFQEDFVTPMIDALDSQMSLMAGSANVKKGTKKMGVENTPFASKTYNYTKQLMLALKVDAIVDRVEQEIKAGRHPVIALESTMEASIKDYNAGDVIGEPTFSASLLRGLDNCMQYTVKDEDGKESHFRYDPRDLGPDGERAYYELQDFIRQSTSGVFISPLDAIIEKLHERGYKVGELTGRNSYVERDADGNVVVKKRTDKDKKRMQRDFNSGALDVLILNKSASTGISLHASEKFSDQRQRSMIIAQPLSDINDYMQMIGRIDRTGQVHRGYYINLGLPVPAESRFLMMLSTKLKSLNANTTTSQESESSNVEAPDLLNKYGSQVIVEYLRDNPDIYVKMGEPLKKSMGQKLKANELDNYEAPKNDEVARKITGYVALLNTKEQEDFYNDVVRRYTDLIKYLDSTGTNDLKITVMPLKAKTLSKSVSSEGKDPNGSNPFAQNAYVEEVEMDVLRKPMKADEIRKSIEQLNTLQGTEKGNVGTAAQDKAAGERALEIAGVVEREEAAKLAAEEERHAAALQSAEAAIAKRREKLSGQQNISEEEKAEKLAEYTAETMQKVNERHEANMNKIRSTTYFMKEGLRRYSVGNTYILPQEGGEDGNASLFTSPAIFCGYKVKESKLTPSTSFAVFATLDGRRRIEVKFTDNQTNSQIGFLTSSNYAQTQQVTLDNWDSHVPTNTRKKGYIMTGNILQAVSDTQDEATGAYVGQLISYTDEEGNIHDGVLMPDRWQPAMLKTSGVPILARLAQLLRGGSVTSTDGKVIITTNRYGDGELSVPKTKKEGEKYFTNETILSAISGGFWEKRGKFNADIVGEDNIRTVVTELSNMGVRVKADPSTDSDVRFRGEEEPVFYSNAMRAVENIKQERATPEQWVKMIEKQGGMKAGEDKWLGLSEWLKGSDAKTLTKGEVLDYIRANEIQIEEVEYGNTPFSPNSKENLESSLEKVVKVRNGDTSFLKFFEDESDYESFEKVLANWDKSFNDHKLEDYQKGKFTISDNGKIITNEPLLEPINNTRLQYTTEGLNNKREIVLTVPTIEPWNEHDEVHFGEAGGGRAVAWVRFGETTDADGKRVLVIDEIQSKRHQEGREKGYKDAKAQQKAGARIWELMQKYNVSVPSKLESAITDEQDLQEYHELLQTNSSSVPDAPFEKNWHKVAMKRMLRFAAENGYDKVAWTKGEQQAERYDLGGLIDHIDIYPHVDNVTGERVEGEYEVFPVDKRGNTMMEMTEHPFSGNLTADEVLQYYGKDLGTRMMQAADKAGKDEKSTIDGEGLRIGGEGMKGFYDQILPRFMDKYGKRWGVKTGEVELPNIGDNGLTMWSVDVTDDMRESVMRGQPLFRNLEESDNVVNNADAGTRPLTDREKIAKLESEPKVKVYRSMQLIDGKLYPPMSARVDGQLREPSEIGVWEEAEEHPELADENGKFKLDKGNKKSLKAAYNPYIHTSRTMLNDQFSEAQSRPNLVVVEVEIPESELNGTYRAEKAKDSIGAKQWKAGVIQGQLSGTREVILSRWAKPVRIVPDAEVAENIARQIDGQVSVMPSNVVTPQVRAELEKRGVRFVETDNTGRLTSGSRKGETWAQVYGKNATKQREGGEEAYAGEWYDRESVERIGEFAGYTSKQIAKMNARQEESARNKFRDAAEKLHLSDNITFADTIDDVPGLTDEQRREWRRKKGWYSPRTGKIVIILGNHKSMDDVMKSILHEGVAHHGLRQMFGEHFNTFLDNVYRVASPEIRDRINTMAKKHGWDFREATEEYLAMLAEDTDFEKPENQSWWKQVKDWFIDLLHKIGFKLHDAYDTITDNELRYILWRSYENLVNPGRYNSVVEEAKDIAKQYDLKVGQWDETWTVAAEAEPNATIEFNGRRVPIWATNGRRENRADRVERNDRMGSDYNVAAEGVAEDGIRFRDGEGEETGAPKPQARGAYERMVSSAASQWKEAMQDSMLSLKKLYQAVSEATSGKSKKKGGYRIEDEKGYENAYLAENRMHSMSEAQIHAYQQDYMKSLQRAIHALTGGKREAYETLTDYMMAKHGLERNEVMAKREAKKAWEEKYKSEQGNPNYTATKNAVFANIDAGVDDLYLEYRKKDYAGLTALTGIEDVEEAEKEAQRMVNEYEQQHDTTDLWTATNRATRRSLFKMLESGLLSPERHAEIRDIYQYYIPLQGFDSDVAEDVYAYMGSDGTRMYGTTIRAAKGRKSKADDPIATIAMNGEAAIRRGNRNLMKQHFLRFVQSHPSDLVSINDVWLRKNANGEWEQYFDADLKETDTPEEVTRKVRDFNERMEQEAAANPDLYKRSRDLPNVPFRVLNVRDMEQHQVMVQVDGKNYLLTINGNPRAAQALNGLTNPDVFTEGAFGSIMNATQSVVRTLSQFYTTRNPNFVLSNFLRDAVYTNSMVLAKESPNYALNFHKNFLLLPNERMGVLFASWENGKLREKLANGTASNMEKMFYDFMMNGGETGWTSLRDIEKHKRDLQKALQREGNIAASALKKMGDFFDITNRMIENHARFTAYVTSIEMGRSVERAVWDAKEISVNFNKKGAGDKFLKAKNQTFVGKVGAFVSGLGRGNYAFWNASLQGLNNIARIGKRNPAKFMAVATTLMGLGVAIPLLNALLGGDDDDDKNAYWNLPEYVRRSNICFRFTKDMPWITIPLPIEFRAIYGLGELGSGVALGKEYYSDSELTKQVAAQFSQVLPLDFMEGGGGWHCIYPTYVKPVIEAYSNQSWTGLPIYRKNTYGQYDVAPEWQRAYSNTNNQIMAATKWLNEATGGDEVQGGTIDLNPARIEYMLRGYLGGYFTVADQVIKMGETATDNREFEWRNMMLANRVVKEGDERTEARKLTNEYFNLKEEYDKTDKSLKAYKKKQDEGTLSVVGQAHYIALMNDSEEYGRYLVFGTYKPLFDAYYKQIKEANAAGDSEEAKRLERGQNELRREMVNIIHDMDNGGTFDRNKVATGINENLKKMQNDKLWDAQDKAINKSIEANNVLNPTDNVEE